MQIFTRNVSLSLRIIPFVFFILTTSGYALSTVNTSMYYFVLIVPTCIMILLLMGKSKRVSLLTARNISFAILLSMGIISLLIGFSTGYYSYSFKYLITILFSYLFTLHVDRNAFIKYYTITMRWLALISLIVHVYVNYLGYALNVPIVENVNGVRYYNGVLFFVFEGYVQGRNTGPFWEPGLFATFLTLALVMEICFKENYTKFNVLIYLLTLLSTQSTAGYFMIIFVGLLLLSRKIKGAISILGFFLMVLSIIIAYINYEAILLYLVVAFPRVFSKMLYQTSSTSDRIISIVTNLKIFIKHPFLGTGLGGVDELYSRLTTATQTATSFYFLAAFGIMGMSYLFFWIYALLKTKRLSIVTRITLVIMVVLILNKEPHTFFTATYISLFYLLQSIQDQRRTNHEMKQSRMVHFACVANKGP